MLTLKKPVVEVAPVQGTAAAPPGAASPAVGTPTATATEVGGRTGPEPTRFGDWEKSGRCIDF
ncbi:MAG: DUF1674 domain-containing protein [Pseudomonadota bacterium]